MKKFTFIIAALIISSAMFAQKVAKIEHRPVDIKAVSISESKGSRAVLNESFSVFPPASWSVNPTTGYWVGSADWTYSAYASSFGDGAFAVFEAFNLDAGEIGYLITPTLTPASGNSTLTFDAIEILLNDEYIATGLQLFVDISTDDGANWINGSSNVLTGITGHNTAGIAQTPTNLSVDLTSYIGQNIKVRFRAISDYGGFDLFLDNVTGPEAAVVLGPTDLVVEAVLQNTMTPLAHATFGLAATVTNIGEDLASAATLNVSVTPGTFTESVAIDVPFVYGASDDFTCTNYFTADAIGTYTATFAAPVAVDPNPGDNTATLAFQVTDNVFATDNGVMLGGGGSNTGALTFGNIFFLMAGDEINSFSIGFPEVTADQNFTVSIYSVDGATGVATHVYTSPTLTKTVAMSDLITEFDIENQTLAAGIYFFAVNQLDATNLSVGYDGVNGGMVYILNTADNTLGGTDQLGNVMVRVNTATEVTPTTCDLEALFMTSNTNPAPIPATLTITVNDDVTVYPGVANNGPDACNTTGTVAFSMDGTEVMSQSVDFTGLTSGMVSPLTASGQTITAADMNTMGLTGTFDVCMSVTYDGTDNVTTNNETCVTITRNPVNVENAIVSNISVFPNPANDVLNVANAENANITIVDMIGNVVATVDNASANQSINISVLSNGTYFVRVNGEVFKFNVVK